MKNAINREIPDELLISGREAFKGSRYRNNFEFTRAAPMVSAGVLGPQESKIRTTLRDAIKQCEPKDGITVSFHHHFRGGDFVTAMVMKELEALGIKDITIATSSIGESVHNYIAELIEKGVVTGLQTSGIRGKVGEAVSYGKLKTPAILRSHGARVRAIEMGEVKIDIAFIGAPTADEMGNANGTGGKSDCGVLSYAMVDAKFANKVVVITDTLVDYPNFPNGIEAIDVDHVVVVDQIGDPKGIATEVIRLTQDPRDLKMAEDCARVMAATEYFKDGYSFQTGAGGPSLAVTRFLEPLMRERGIKMGWALGGITQPMVDLMKKGLISKLFDAQSFDIASVKSVHENANHHEISTSQYANPMNKGALVSKLDFVILGALEIDVDWHVNSIIGSDGVLRGAPGGHPDTAAGSKCCIIVGPLVRGRMPTVLKKVVTVSTPGEDIDVLVTDYGIAVNPKRTDLIQALGAAGIELTTIDALREKAYSLVGEPEDLQFKDKVVAIMEARDGTILDVVRQVKPYVLE